MADNQYGYSTGYPGFGDQPAAQSNAFYGNYSQWNAQSNYNNTSTPHTPSPSGAPPQGYQSYNHPPPSFLQQPAQSNNFTSSEYSGNDRNSGSGNRSGGINYNSGPSRDGCNKDTRSGDFIVQEDTIFISGMDPRTSEQEIKTHFGAIGLIKIDKKTGKPKIWIYMDKTSGRPKGEATVTYDDAQTATSAINWFHGKDFNGFSISVQLASRRDNWQGGRGGGGHGGGGRGGGRGRGGPRNDYDDNRGGYNRGGDNDFGGGRNDNGGYRGDREGGMDYGGRNHGGGYRDNGRGPGGSGFKGGNRDGGRERGERGGGGGGKGFGGREGDWRCPNSDCGNTNFSWRQQCNRCNEEKPADAGSSGGDSDRRGGSSRGRGGFGGRGGGGGRDGSRGSGRGGGPMREDYGNQRSRPY